MQEEIAIGTPIERGDEVVGTVERVERDSSTGRLQSVVLRSGRSKELVRLDARSVRRGESGSLVLDPGMDLTPSERNAIDSGRLPPVGEHIQDGGATEESPSPEHILGNESGLPDSYDGPATG